MFCNLFEGLVGCNAMTKIVFMYTYINPNPIALQYLKCINSNILQWCVEVVYNVQLTNRG